MEGAGGGAEAQGHARSSWVAEGVALEQALHLRQLEHAKCQLDAALWAYNQSLSALERGHALGPTPSTAPRAARHASFACPASAGHALFFAPPTAAAIQAVAYEPVQEGVHLAHHAMHHCAHSALAAHAAPIPVCCAPMSTVCAHVSAVPISTAGYSTPPSPATPCSQVMPPGYRSGPCAPYTPPTPPSLSGWHSAAVTPGTFQLPSCSAHEHAPIQTMGYVGHTQHLVDSELYQLAHGTPVVATCTLPGAAMPLSPSYSAESAGTARAGCAPTGFAVCSEPAASTMSGDSSGPAWERPATPATRPASVLGDMSLDAHHGFVPWDDPGDDVAAASRSANTGDENEDYAGNDASAAEPAEAAPVGAEATSRLPHSVWSVHLTEAGQRYYHNALTGETQWDVPAALMKSEDEQERLAGVEELSGSVSAASDHQRESHNTGGDSSGMGVSDEPVSRARTAAAPGAASNALARASVRAVVEAAAREAAAAASRAAADHQAARAAAEAAAVRAAAAQCAAERAAAALAAAVSDAACSETDGLDSATDDWEAVQCHEDRVSSIERCVEPHAEVPDCGAERTASADEPTAVDGVGSRRASEEQVGNDECEDIDGTEAVDADGAAMAWAAVGMAGWVSESGGIRGAVEQEVVARLLRYVAGIGSERELWFPITFGRAERQLVHSWAAVLGLSHRNTRVGNAIAVCVRRRGVASTAEPPQLLYVADHLPLLSPGTPVQGAGDAMRPSSGESAHSVANDSDAPSEVGGWSPKAVEEVEEFISSIETLTSLQQSICRQVLQRAALPADSRGPTLATAHGPERVASPPTPPQPFELASTVVEVAWRSGSSVLTVPTRAGRRVAMAAECPHDFLCPISLELMRDPVFTSDGKTYDRNTISRWLRKKSTSPLTGLRLESAELQPNLEMRARIRKWLEAHGAINMPAVNATADDINPDQAGAAGGITSGRTAQTAVGLSPTVSPQAVRSRPARLRADCGNEHKLGMPPSLFSPSATSHAASSSTSHGTSGRSSRTSSTDETFVLKRTIETKRPVGTNQLVRITAPSELLDNALPPGPSVDMAQALRTVLVTARTLEKAEAFEPAVTEMEPSCDGSAPNSKNPAARPGAARRFDCKAAGRNTGRSSAHHRGVNDTQPSQAVLGTESRAAPNSGQRRQAPKTMQLSPTNRTPSNQRAPDVGVAGACVQSPHANDVTGWLPTARRGKEGSKRPSGARGSASSGIARRNGGMAAKSSVFQDAYY